MTLRRSLWFGLLAVASLLWVCPSAGCRRQLRRCLPVCQLDCERAQWSLHGPPLVVYPDGRYKIWAERPTYRIDGNQLKLSESKKQGRGRLLRGRLIVFKFSYRGKKHKVTSQRSDPLEAGTAII
jgi:hypothetical protein